MPDQVRHDEARPADKWHKALARYRAAEAALEAVTGTADDDLFGRHLGRFNAALKRLLRTPARDVADLAAKLDLVLAHQVFELTGGELCLAALQADAHRLAAASGCRRAG
jgi:hypothetical protein